MKNPQFFKAILEQMRTQVCVRDLDKNILYINPATEKLTGYRYKEVVGKKCYEIFGDEEQACKECCSVEKIISQNLNIRHHYGKLKTCFNEEKNIHASISPFYEGEKLLGAMVVVEDVALLQEMKQINAKTVISLENEIKNRKRAEKKLLENEYYLKEAQMIAKLGHWKLKPDTGKMFGSDELFNILGLTRQEASLEAFSAVIHPKDREYGLSHVERGIEEGISWDIEYLLVLKDGTKKTVQAKGSPIIDSSGKVTEIIGTIQDISSKKQLEEQVQRSQKMDSIGILAGGIAHEFNNLLYVISGTAEVLSMDAKEENKGFLQEIIETTQRGANLVKQLMAFSRKSEMTLYTAHLNIEIKKLKKMLDRVLPRMVHIKLDLTNDLLPIKADKGQIEQVILNLCLNAKDAMPDGGTLTIRTESSTLDTSFIDRHPGKSTHLKEDKSVVSRLTF